MTVVRRLLAPGAADLVGLLEAPGPTCRGLERLEAALGARLCALDAPPRRLDAFVAEHGLARFATPFRWSARAARRTLGTGALRRVAAGAVRDPLSGAREELASLCDRSRRGLSRRGALGAWLADAPAEARALCEVEAASWATALAQLVDLDAHAGQVRVGLADAWHAIPGAAVTLHGRRDADVEGGGLLRLRDGAPGARALDGLLVDGLVAALAGPAAPPRVLGAWPDAGVALAVELDDEALRAGARALVAPLPTAPSRAPERVLAA